jgi:hypothetical protein
MKSEFRAPFAALALAALLLGPLALPGPSGATVTAVNTGYTWQSIGPTPMLNQPSNFGGWTTGSIPTATGRVTAVAVDPNSTGTIYAGTAGGGVWKSTDNGSTFTPVFDSEPSLAIGAITIDATTNPSTIYVGTGEANGSADSYYGKGLFKSTDGGTTWTALGQPWTSSTSTGTFGLLSFAKIVVTHFNGQTIILAATTATGGSSNRAEVYMPEATPGTGGLYRSADGGQTWTRVSGDPSSGINCAMCATEDATDVAVDPASPGLVYVAMNHDEVYQSTDGGATWTGACSTATPPSFCGVSTIGRISLATAPQGDNSGAGVLYVLVATLPAPPESARDDPFYGFYRMSTSSGGAVTWTEETVPTQTWDISSGGCVIVDGDVSAPSESCANGSGAHYDSQSFYDQTIAVSPGDSTTNTIFVGGLGPYLSQDGGSTWTFLAQSGEIHTDQHAAEFNPGNPDQLLIGNDGGIYRYDISLSQAASLNETINAGQVYGVAPYPNPVADGFPADATLAGFQDNALQTNYSSGMSGTEWSDVQVTDGSGSLNNRIYPATDASMPTFGCTNSSMAFASIVGGGLMASSDGGLDWTIAAPTAYLKTALVDNNDTPAQPFGPLASVTQPGQSDFLIYGGSNDIYSSADLQNWTAGATGGSFQYTACQGGPCALEDIEPAVPCSGGLQPQTVWTLSRTATVNGTGYGPVIATNSLPINDYPPAVEVGGSGVFQFPFDASKTQATSIAIAQSNGTFKKLYVALSGYSASTQIPHHIYTPGGNSSMVAVDGSSLPDVPVLSLLVDASDPTQQTMLAGTDSGLYLSQDGGSTWRDFGQGVVPHVPVFDIRQNAVGAITVGTHGRGVYRLPPPENFVSYNEGEGEGVCTSSPCSITLGTPLYSVTPGANGQAQTVSLQKGDVLVLAVTTFADQTEAPTLPPGWTQLSGGTCSNFDPSNWANFCSSDANVVYGSDNAGYNMTGWLFAYTYGSEGGDNGRYTFQIPIYAKNGATGEIGYWLGAYRGVSPSASSYSMRAWGSGGAAVNSLTFGGTSYSPRTVGTEVLNIFFIAPNSGEGCEDKNGEFLGWTLPSSLYPDSYLPASFFAAGDEWSPAPPPGQNGSLPSFTATSTPSFCTGVSNGKGIGLEWQLLTRGQS